MTEGNFELQNKINKDRATIQKIRNKFYLDYKEGGIDLVQLNRYSDMFDDGIKDGSVRFEPKKDGTGTLFINTVLEGEKETRELTITIDNKDEAAFFVGLQMSLNPPEEK